MKNDNRDIPIVYAVNGWGKAHEWLEHAIGCVRKHLGDRKIFILTDALEEAERRGYENDRNIEVVDVVPFVRMYNLDVTEQKKWHNRPASPMMMIRLYIPFIPQLSEYDKVLYMDIDTEIVDEKFGTIFDIDIPDVMIAGVLDQRNNDLRRESYSRKCRKFIWRNGLEFFGCYKRLQDRIYINSGVMLMNTELMRKDGPSQMRISQLVNLSMRDNLNNVFDQDIINSVYSIRVISSSFNTFRASHKSGDPVWCLHHVSSGKLKCYPYLHKEDFE